MQVAVLTAAGLGLAIAFTAELVLPIEVGIVSLFAIALYALVWPAAPRLGMLNRLMVLVYAIPFSVLLGYLVERDYVWMLTPRGQELIEDRVLIAQMIALGTIGLLGLCVGYRLAAFGRMRAASTSAGRRVPTLALIIFVPLAVAAVGLSWFSTPAETIFQAAYFVDQSTTAADKVNFPAAYLVSYIVLLILYLDAEREADAATRRTKALLLVASIGYIVVVLQLLRGNRESSGLLAALFGLYVTAPWLRHQGRDALRRARRRLVAAGLPLAAVGAIFIALGEARGTFTEVSARVDARQIFLLGLSQNTWTAVLWTHLGSTWEYRTGLLNYRYGRTYLDYVLSLPPGIVTRAVGIERPIDKGERGGSLAHENPAGVSAGGLHVVIPPFKNFGAVGVFGILALYGVFIARVERAHAGGSLWGRFLWAAVLCAGLQWFWYGDMTFLRALLAAVALYGAYRVLLGVRLAAPRPALRPLDPRSA